MLRLAIPVVLAELGWMAMGLVDTIMVGRVGATAIGAVSIGGTLFYTVAVFGAGLMLGLDTLVSQAFGAGKISDCHKSFLNAIYLYLPLAPLMMLLVWAAGAHLGDFGVNPQILQPINEYLHAIAWGTLPLLIYFASRRYLQGMGLAKPVTFALVTANIVHIFANYALIFGHWGAPRMGATGAGWATCFSRVYMAGCLVFYIFWYDRKHRTGLLHTPPRPDLARMKRLLRLGLPAGLQISLECGVFAAATALTGRLAPEILAAHQIALNCATVTYMVPLGIGSAAAVRVGHAIGRGDPRGALHAGWTAIALGAGFMFCAAVAFIAVPRTILQIYTKDPAIISAGIPLLAIAALFQLFDGVQTVSTGALRGAGDTRTPMIANFIGYWIIGLPLGYWLCFSLGWSAVGLWTGLCCALILIAVALLWQWHRRSDVIEWPPEVL
jgi:MATE family multidrug resistance protein